MPVSIRTGGSWYAPPSGNLRIRSSGAWRGANTCNIKVGPIGSGSWYDSGYRGYPAVPSTPLVTGWDYSNVNVGWSGGSGGAPVSYYQLQRLDVSGNQMNLDYYSGGQSNNYPVNWDGRYQFRVRAVSTGGLISDWSGMLRVGIGHPQQDTYGYVSHTRAWEAHYSGRANANEWMAVVVPTGVLLNGIHWRNLHTPMSSSVTPGTNRDVNWIFANGDFGTIRATLGNVPSGSNVDWGGGISGNQGNGTYWGIVPRGSGWSTTGNPTFMLWVDDLWFDGTETYQNWELTSRINEQGNYYW
jgi:hypothetical protein